MGDVESKASKSMVNRLTRRSFMLGSAAVAGAAAGSLAMGSISSSRAWAANGTVNFVTWPNYIAPDNVTDFNKHSGAQLNVIIGNSNQEFITKMQIGSTGWDVLVANNQTVQIARELKLIKEIDLTRVPNYDPKSQIKTFADLGVYDGKTYGLPKNWGTEGFMVNTNKLKKLPSSYREFFEMAKGEASGHVVMPDDPLTCIGFALRATGHHYDSVDPKDLADAEALLLDVKPHFFALNTDYQPSIRSGDAWLGGVWSGDATQLMHDMPSLRYVFGSEGNTAWCDYYMIPNDAENLDGAYAFLNFILDPKVNLKEVKFHGYPPADDRVKALLPKEILDNTSIYPPKDAPLDTAGPAAVTNAQRAEIYARFKAA
jgi:spermidine/putrescine transport system substrate-binding protein